MNQTTTIIVLTCFLGFSSCTISYAFVLGGVGCMSVWDMRSRIPSIRPAYCQPKYSYASSKNSIGIDSDNIVALTSGRSSKSSRRCSQTALFVSSGFSFADGDQILVSVQKPLGILFEQDDNEDEEGEGGPIIVVEVDPNGSAARAGVQVGDVLLAVQNASVENKSLEYAIGFIGQAPQVLNLRFLRITAS